MAGQISDMLMIRMRQVVDAFVEWDTDCSGAISYTEFHRAMAALGLKAPKKLSELWGQFDKDGSGEIDYQELVDALAPSRLEAAKPLAYAPEMVPAERIHAEMKVGVTAKLRSPAEQLHEAFEQMATERVLDVLRAWDTDGSRTISRPEFAKALVSLGVVTTKREMLRLFNELDPDHSGDIEFRELYWAIKNKRWWEHGGVETVSRPGPRWE